ncbi:ABC-type lipoprotein export system ATPase subunit [Kitasatospora sp. MAA19]|uniref:AAA family ATPase n=1 Tax=unclassified Kitasatospora TaxID=2633591 RepID=UPI00247535F9|nr:AAA family ATPase [Kitasatospora sp. MAA19]MDH6710171.1 ABC-type lipoprotein export system ATPase subunit [Kitasatospora sp. MAA19]
MTGSGTWAPRFANARYPTFGPVLIGIRVQGFRGVSDLNLQFKSPVTAISGLNGTGKSTVAQLAAAGFRQPPDHDWYRYYVNHFFPVSVADPEPFTPGAQVQYLYAADSGFQTVTVSRSAKSWSGQHRQPERATYYRGFAQFIPKVERRDLSIYGAASLELGEANPLDPTAAQHVGRILAVPYDHLGFTEVLTTNKAATLAMAGRGGRRYSENHMGTGEGRVLYMVNTLETAPPKSLVIFEEPETSLHGDAQVRLAQYFVEVALRRGHQIIITTHSSAILGQLGRDSVVYLRRTPLGGGVTATHGLSTYQTDSHLQREGRTPGGITVCVEDEFARCLASEIFRTADPDLLSGCSFLTIGGGQEIPAAVKLLRGAKVRAVGLSDGDMPHNGTGGVRTLPGTEPPEKEVFAHPAVKDYFAAAPFEIDLDEVLAGVSDHHDYARTVAARLMMDEPTVVGVACRTYAAAHQAGAFNDVVGFVRSEVGDRR